LPRSYRRISDKGRTQIVTLIGLEDPACRLLFDSEGKEGFVSVIVCTAITEYLRLGNL
jgi:hypothetical protein